MIIVYYQWQLPGDSRQRYKAIIEFAVLRLALPVYGEACHFPASPTNAQRIYLRPVVLAASAVSS